MSPSGKIDIVLHHQAGRAYKASIVKARPDAASLLCGKSPEQVLDTVHLLYSLCSNGQSYAALQACRGAMGRASEPELDAAHEILVQLETLREHVWRILLDWPQFAGRQADKKPLAEFFKFDAQFKRHLFREGQAFKLDSVLDIDEMQLTELIARLETLLDAAIFQSGLSDFQAICGEADLQYWLQHNRSLPACLLSEIYCRDWVAIGANHIDVLPQIDPQTFSRQMQQEDLSAYFRMPQWRLQCYENTALNRQLRKPLIADLQGRYGNGLIVRLLAILLEVSGSPSRLKLLLQEIATGSVIPVIEPVGEGLGLGMVQAARGLLIHRLELRQGLIRNYCIVAPTEWNFHPDGVVAQGLKNLETTGADELRLQAELLINSVAPCVQYGLRLMDVKQELENHA